MRRLTSLPPWVIRLVSLTGTLGALGLASWLLDWEALRSSWERLSVTSLLLCAALCVLTHGLIAWRWSLLASAPAERASLREMLVSLHASLFNLITPGAIGADAHRIFNGVQRRGGRGGSAGLVLIERTLGVAAQAAVYVAAFAIACFATRSAGRGQLPSFMGLAAIAFAALALVIAAGLAWGLPWAGARLFRQSGLGAEHLAQILSNVRLRPSRLVALGILSIAAVAAWIAAAASLAHGAGLTTSLATLAVVVVLTEFARLVPISIQGIGVREATFSILIAQTGGDAAAGFLVCTVLYLVNYVVIGAVGLVAWLALLRWDGELAARFG